MHQRMQDGEKTRFKTALKSEIHGGIMQKQRIRIYDIENIPFATYVTIRFVDGAEEKAIVYADNFAFENGNTIKFQNIGNCVVYLGWQ